MKYLMILAVCALILTPTYVFGADKDVISISAKTPLKATKVAELKVRVSGPYTSVSSQRPITLEEVKPLVKPNQTRCVIYSPYLITCHAPVKYYPGVWY